MHIIAPPSKELQCMFISEHIIDFEYDFGYELTSVGLANCSKLSMGLSDSFCISV